MTTLATAFVEVRPDMSTFNRQLTTNASQSADRAGVDAGKRFSSRFGSALKIGAMLTGALAVAKGGQFLKESISEASNLGESLNAVNVTFGKNAEGIKLLGREAADAVGLSNNEFNGLAVQFSAFAGTIAGKGGNVVKTIKDLTIRGADFASVMNLDVNEAMGLFQSGLAGETEPLRKFGIDLSAAAVEAHGLKLGMDIASEGMTEQQKVQARYSLLMKSTSKTQDDFKNTSDSLANSQRILGARFDDIQARVGAKLIPVLEDLASWVLRDGLPLVDQFGEMLSGIDMPELKMPDIDFAQVGADLQTFVKGLGEARDDLPEFASFLNLGGKALKFAAENTDLLVKALPYLAAAFLAVKIAQVAGNVAAAASIPLRVIEVITNHRLIKSHAALIVAMNANTGSLVANTTAEVASTTVKNAGIVASTRSRVATIAKTVAERVAAGASKALAAATWLVNLALRANPIGLVITALTGLGVGLVVAYKKSATFRKIVQGAWSGIKTAVQGAWNGVIKPVFSALSGFVTGVLVPVIKGLWAGVVKPVFKFISGAIKVAWAVVRTVFQAWWSFMKNVLFPVIKLLWEGVVRPLFTQIGNKIRTVWTEFIRPTFDALKDGVGRIKDAFRTAVDAIGRIWEGLKDAAAAPVRFVVDTVYNNGIRKVVNAIPGVTDLPTLSFAGGGVLPGFTPGRDVHRFFSPTAGELNLSGGEAIMRPEFTRMVGGERGVAALNAKARKRMHGPIAREYGSFFLGGVTPMVGTTSVSQHTSGYPWAQWAGDLNGAGDDTGKAAVAWKSGTVASAGWGGADSYGNVMRLNHGSQSTLYAHLNSFVASAGAAVRAGQTIGRVGSTGNSSGPHLHFEVKGGSVSGGAGVSSGPSPKESMLSKFGDALKAVKSFVSSIPGTLSRLASMSGWGPMIKDMARSLANSVGGYINDKIPNRFLPDNPIPTFDRGGVATGVGVLQKNTLRPERVLSPRTTETFDRFVTAMEGGRAGGPLVNIEQLVARDEHAAMYAARVEAQKALTMARLPA